MAPAPSSEALDRCICLQRGRLLLFLNHDWHPATVDMQAECARGRHQHCRVFVGRVCKQCIGASGIDNTPFRST